MPNARSCRVDSLQYLFLQCGDASKVLLDGIWRCVRLVVFYFSCEYFAVFCLLRFRCSVVWWTTFACVFQVPACNYVLVLVFCITAVFVCGIFNAKCLFLRRWCLCCACIYCLYVVQYGLGANSWITFSHQSIIIDSSFFCVQFGSSVPVKVVW